MNTSLTIKDKILFGLDIQNLQGVEIGPLTNPLVRKDVGNVKYIDRATTEEIKDWYRKNKTVDLEKIVDVDHVWGQETLAQALGKNEKFDYCIAAHVIEHVPDLIGWLKEISEILCDNGVASFSVPDRRYTFDYLRSETVPADLIDAYHRKLKKPSIRHIFDHFSSFTEIDIVEAWSDNFDGSNLIPVKDPRKVNTICEDAQKNDKYIDSHCWVFTAMSFIALLDSLSAIGLFDFRIKRFFEVEYRNFEFVIQLEKLPSSLTNGEKRKLFTESLKKTRDHIVRVQFQSFPTGEAQIYWDSGKGFNEYDSSTRSYSLSGKKIELEFKIPPVFLKRLRFDPVKAAAIFRIFSIEILLFGDERHSISLDSLQAGEHIKIAKQKNGYFFGRTYRKAADPHVTMELSQDIQECS